MCIFIISQISSSSQKIVQMIRRLWISAQLPLDVLERPRIDQIA